MKEFKLIFLSITLVFITSLPLAAYAEDCRRGTLDKAYCDEDLDLVADLPQDESKWVNPSTIIFTYTPVEDPAVYANIWDGFVRHMSKTSVK